MLNFRIRICSVILSFFLILSLLLLACYITLNPDTLSGFSSPGLSNEYCKKIKEKGENASYIEKTTCINKYKKSKFIWILLDGLALDQLTLLRNRVKYNIPNFFKISTNHYRQSGALHETYLTGKFSRNFPANEVKIDHILNQAAKSDYPIYYRGNNFPLYFLLGENQKNILKDCVIKRNEYYPLQNMCANANFLNLRRTKFPENLIDDNGDLLVSREEFDKYLQENHKWKGSVEDITKCLENSKIHDEKQELNNSFVFYTMIIDHFNHSFYKFSSHTIREVYSLEVSLLMIIKWIERHSDYALIISSDHGGQPYNGEDNICNHGCMEKGNEAIMTIYTKELAEANEDIKLLHDVDSQIEDVAPTIAQILENVNIPLESTGFPMYLNEDKLLKIVALKSKEAQLIEKINEYVLNLKNFNSLTNISEEIKNSSYSKILNSLKNRENVDEIEDFENFLINYKTFLTMKQSEINSEIKKSSKSIISSLIAYSLILFLFFNLFSSFALLIKSITHKNLETNNKNLIISICSLLLILFLDIIFSMISKNIVKAYDNIHLITYILIFTAWIILHKYYFSKKENQQLTKDCNIFLIGLSIIIFVIIFFAYTDLFLTLKFKLSNFQLAKKLDIFNYIILVIFIIWSTMNFRNYYIFSCCKIRLDVFLFFFYTILISLMVVFDYNLPVHFTNQTLFMQKLVKTIYCLMIFYLILTFKKFYRKEGEPVILFQFFKYPLIIYLYFISDEAERIFLFSIILPLFYFFSFFVKKFTHDLLRILAFASLIIVPDVIYTLKRGSLSFDVSLKVSSKCIGFYPDETPLVTGFLMGTHKMKLFILAGCFILDHVEYGKNFYNKSFHHFKIIMEMQWNLLIIFYIFYIYRDYEEYYLNLFIWTGTKCVYILLVDLVAIYHYLLNHKGDYKKIKTEEEFKLDDIEQLT